MSENWMWGALAAVIAVVVYLVDPTLLEEVTDTLGGLDVSGLFGSLGQ